MKQHFLKLSIGLIIVVFGWTTCLFANHDPDAWTPKKDLRHQIFKLIEKPDLSNTDFYQTEANLHFIVNALGEIVVLEVDTENDFVDTYLKQRLNYQKLTKVFAGQYKIKITIKSSSSSI